MKKFSTELAYFVGIFAIALGVAFMEAADFGVSMIVAPAYLVYRKMSLLLPFFTFGMAEYLFQAVLLIVLCVFLRRFRVSFLFSFATAVFYGFVLDAMMWLVAFLPHEGFLLRTVFYFLGMALGAVGVSFIFKTYIAPEVYELFVKEVALKLQKPIPKVKTVYDCCSCALGIVFSFAFFGFGVFEGVKLGTVLCALVNGRMIGAVTAWLDKTYVFTDTYPLKKYFEQ